MPARFSLDANILIYTARRGDPRQDLALSIIAGALGSQGSCVLTLQALGEFFTACARKGYATRPEAAAQVRQWRTLFPLVQPATVAAMEAALTASTAGRFGYWDALLLATAAEAGCEALISEDMAAGAALNGSRVVPAFAGGAVSAEALAILGGP